MPAAARIARGVAVATSLATSFTCASPTSPVSRLDNDARPDATTSSGAPASVTVTLVFSQVDVGKPSFASARVRDAAGRQLFGLPVTWRSDNTAVATVQTNGYIRTWTAGTATIAATVSGLSGQAVLTVGSAPPPQVATQLAIMTQPGGAVAGATLSPQPVVHVRDASNAIVGASSAPVTAVIASGSGILGGTTTVNAVNGVASFTDLSITGAGTYVLAFVSTGLTQVASNEITISAPPSDPATQLVMVTQPAGNATSGAVLATQPSVGVRDAANNPVQSDAPVTAAIASGAGTLGGTTTVASVGGVATFTDLRITGVGTFTLVFTSSGLTQATSSAITVTAAPATQLAMVTQPSSSATSGALLGTQPAVALRDASNGPVSQSGITVTAAIASGVGVLSGTTTVATVSGVASFTNLRITGIGTYILVFTASGLTNATSSAVSVTAAPATQLTMVAQPSSSALSGAVFAAQPAVALRDASNSPVGQAGVNVTAAIATGGGTLGGTLTVPTDAEGVARFTNLSISGEAGDRTLRFTASSLTATTSGTVSITVTEPPPPPPSGRRVIFASDWSTATGDSDAARRDVGKRIPWGGYGGAPGVTDVIPATGLNFPTTNVLRVNGIRTGGAIQWIHTGQLTMTAYPYSGVGLGDLPVGESNYYRLYMHVVYPPDREALANGNHPIEETAGGGQNWAWTFIINQHGWRPRLGARVSTRYALSSGGNEANAIYLARATTYRLEWQIRRTSVTNFEMHARIYNAAGVLLYDDDDFVAMSQVLSSNPQHTLNDPNTLRRFQLGTNGPSLRNDPITDIGPMWYLGGVAVCRGTWCGPYTPGESP
jgi:hypothetical protein